MQSACPASLVAEFFGCCKHLFVFSRHLFPAGIEPATRGFRGPLLYQLSYKFRCCGCLYNSVRSRARLQLPGRAVPPEYFKMHFQSFTSGKSNAFPGIHRMKNIAVCIFKIKLQGTCLKMFACRKQPLKFRNI